MDLLEIEARLVAAVSDVEDWLPADQLAALKALVRAGEPGVVLQSFCAQLLEYDVELPENVVRELTDLASRWE
jgi:hypothetical protein